MPSVSAITRLVPATTPGMLSGTVTRQKVCQGDAPRLCEARSSTASTDCSALAMGSIMKGSSTCTVATITEPKVPSMRRGRSISPSESSVPLTTPLLASSTTHP